MVLLVDRSYYQMVLLSGSLINRWSYYQVVLLSELGCDLKACWIMQEPVNNSQDSKTKNAFQGT